MAGEVTKLPTSRILPTSSSYGRSSAGAFLLRTGSKSGKDLTEDTVQVGLDVPYKGLTIFADGVLARLERIINAPLPRSVVALSPEAHTEATAVERIATGVAHVLRATSGDAHAEEKIWRAVENSYEETSQLLSRFGASSALVELAQTERRLTERLDHLFSATATQRLASNS